MEYYLVNRDEVTNEILAHKKTTYQVFRQYCFKYQSELKKGYLELMFAHGNLYVFNPDNELIAYIENYYTE